MNIGVLGGTFDPIHLGHLAIAEEAAGRLGLSRVMFVPASLPWLKEGRDLAPAEERLEMIERAIAPEPRFSASRVDLGRPGPSYTVDTLADLRAELGEGAELYFIVGMDTLAGLAGWREPGRIVELCRLVAARRPGCDDADIEGLERAVPGISGRVTIMDNPLIDINSTDVRQRVASGLSIEGMVPDEVARYIEERGLYR